MSRSIRKRGWVALAAGLARPAPEAGSEARRVTSDPWILGLAGIVLVAQLAYAFLADPLFDQDGYRDLGRDFANYWETAHLASPMRTPGYPLLLAVSYELGLGDAGVKVLQAVAMGVALVATAALAELTAGRLAARLVAAAFAVYLPLWSYSAVAMTETAAITAIVLSALALVLAQRHPEHRVRWAFASATFAVVATLVRPNAVLFLAVVVLALVLTAGGTREAVRTAAVVTLPVVALFGPWVGRNLSEDVGAKPFGSNADYPLALGVHLPFDDDIGAFSPYRRSVRFFSGTRPDGFTPARAAEIDAWEVLRTNVAERPAEFLWSRAVAQFQLWFWPVTPRVSYGRSEVVPYPLLMTLHLAILGAGLAGLIAMRRTLVGRVALGFLLLLVLSHLLHWATPRYALPMFPFLLFGAGVALALAQRRLVELRAPRPRAAPRA